ncbi:nucleotidyl transferase AbiEii/AbiGii toxin family protein [Frigoribacterium sp. CFBP 13707]|uniref:nucleotidyl transferase AbiEii/AbiGii toxin family protein n=1 Tax=Frigoribacterium sp. CFBP 13707 TaxID=2775313 RepID=UPI00177F55E5|nr:nucleotidyl transferase AbiEii/AbiGii toxin family protein [Frigoribacterium sp. CFBP 13707]MBD8729398.1 nucleotidyl transferase AbiEii/AbiGii toxin family protein [Frigoribacterium sp. CFBP 13707]
MTMTDGYADGFALHQAANAQARSDERTSGVPTQTAMTQLVFDRFLCRVFSDPLAGFALKGGTGMLARIPTGRATRDVDLEHQSLSVAAAVDEMTRLAAVDLQDFHRFTKGPVRRMVGGNQPDIEGTRVTFNVDLLGPMDSIGRRRIKRLGPVAVDLAIHNRPTRPLARQAPRFRLELSKPLIVHDYLMISVEDQIADKAAAMMDTSYASGEGSSRAKDLIDIVLLARHSSIRAETLRLAIEAERSRRRISTFTSLTATPAIQTGFAKVAAKTSALPKALTWQSALETANSLVEPALTEAAHDRTWDPTALRWS